MYILCKWYIFLRNQCFKRVKTGLRLQNIIVHLIMGLNKILHLNSVLTPQAVFIMYVTIVIESSNGNLFWIWKISWSTREECSLLSLEELLVMSSRACLRKHFSSQEYPVFWAQTSIYVMPWHHVKVYAYSVIMIITIVKYTWERCECLYWNSISFKSIILVLFWSLC